MDSFRFRCITVARTSVQKGVFIKAINNKGPVELFVYGKKTPVDNMNLVEVAGFYKSSNREYLVVKHLDVLDRFQENRESFSKLSTSLLMVEIAYKTKIGMELLIKGLTMMKSQSNRISFLWFLTSFLVENGMFNKEGFSKRELAQMNYILNATDKSGLHLSADEFNALKKKLLNYIKDYANTDFSSLKFSGSL